MSYDICVVGNDEASFEVLNLSASLQQRTLAVLPVVRHSSWLVTQALRALISDLLVDCDINRRRQFRRSASPSLLRSLISRAVSQEVSEHVSMLKRLGIEVVFGEPQLASRDEDNGTLLLRCNRTSYSASNLVLCTGIRHMMLDRTIPNRRVASPEALLGSRVLPEAAGIIGGSDFGAGLAGLLSLLGVNTWLVALDDEASAMHELAADTGAVIVEHLSEINPKGVEAERIELIDCRRTVGFTKHLNLGCVDVEPDEHGKLWCAANMETWCAGIFGAGAVVGFSPDTSLHPTIQAEQIMKRIHPAQMRPHFNQSLRRVSA